MKKWLFVFSLLWSVTLAEDELKVYGIITYLAHDNTLLRLGDMTMMLSNSDIEGLLTVGSLIRAEGFWQGQTFYAQEVEVVHPEAEVVVYRGRVQDGRLLGLDWPGLTDGVWLEVVAEHTSKGLTMLLIRPLTLEESSIQATVERLTREGFVAGGVQVISSQTVKVGQQVTVQGDWNGSTLIENPEPNAQ